MSASVLVTLSRSRQKDETLGGHEPFGELRSVMVHHNIVLCEIVRWVTGRANYGVEIVELGEEKLVVSYEYDLSHVFGIPPDESDEPYYGWLYTIERNPDDPFSSIFEIVEVVYAMCVVSREICSDEVASKVAEAVESANVASVENLRDALMYYGSTSCWEGDRLVSPFRQAEPGGRPWDQAYNALMGRYVKPLKQVTSEIGERWRNQPDFLKR